jgi:hypothetical protein
MRALNTILSAVSLVLLALVLFFFVRSYFRFDGALHYAEGKPTVATASGNNQTLEQEIAGRSTGVTSYRGQLTWVSIANPIRADDWETWSVPADQPYSKGPMLLVWELRDNSGLRWGATKTRTLVRDPIMGISWQLPYTFFSIPYWMLVLGLAILPYLWVTSFVRASRSKDAPDAPAKV